MVRCFCQKMSNLFQHSWEFCNMNLVLIMMLIDEFLALLSLSCEMIFYKLKTLNWSGIPKICIKYRKLLVPICLLKIKKRNIRFKAKLDSCQADTKKCRKCFLYTCVICLANTYLSFSSNSTFSFSVRICENWSEFLHILECQVTWKSSSESSESNLRVMLWAKDVWHNNTEGS